MSKHESEWPAVELIGSEQIDTLKEEEKQKLDAAAGTGTAVAPRPPAPAEEEEVDGDEWGEWLPGLVLIGIGGYFLLSNLTGLRLDNWWALFILIPGLGTLAGGWRAYRAAGRMTGDVWGAVAGGLTMLLIASAFLFGLSWGLIWPFFLIIGGIGVLLGARDDPNNG